MKLVRKSWGITTCKAASMFKFHFCIEKGANANCEVQRIGTVDRNSRRIHHHCFSNITYAQEERDDFSIKKNRII